MGKTEMTVLKNLISIDQGIAIQCPAIVLAELLPNLSKPILEAALLNLNEEGLIGIEFSDNELSKILIQRPAYVYLKNWEESELDKAETETNRQKEKWESRLWDIAKIIMGGILGYVIATIQAKFR